MNSKNFFRRILYNKKSRRGFKISKYRANRTNFNNVIRRKINYNFNNRTQTYGPNSTVLNITGLLNWDLSDSNFTYGELVSGVINSDEFKKFSEDFEYVKILGIGVTVYPNDALNNEPTYIDLDWTGNNMTYDDIAGSDRAKIIYNDAKRQKTFYYRPPDVITYDNYNPRKFNIISNFSYSSVYLTVSQQGGTFKGRVDMRLCFKGPLTKQNQIEIKQVKVKKNNEIKMENKKKIYHMKENNLKQEFSVDETVSNYSFLVGLIQDGIEENKIKGSKNYKKLSDINKNKIKKLLTMRRSKKNIDEYIENEKKKKKEKKKLIRKNKKINKTFNKNNNEENEEVEDLKNQLEEKKKENYELYNNLMKERQKIFYKEFELKDQLKNEENEINNLKNIYNNLSESEEKNKINELIKKRNKTKEKIEQKLVETDSEIEKYQRDAGIYSDDD